MNPITGPEGPQGPEVMNLCISLTAAPVCVCEYVWILHTYELTHI